MIASPLQSLLEFCASADWGVPVSSCYDSTSTSLLTITSNLPAANLILAGLNLLRDSTSCSSTCKYLLWKTVVGHNLLSYPLRSPFFLPSALSHLTNPCICCSVPSLYIIGFNFCSFDLQQCPIFQTPAFAYLT